jgi:hypothetical protein
LGDTFPDDEPFPLTADEALWLLRGYLVVPASGPVTFAVLDKLPGRIELISGGLRIAR